MAWIEVIDENEANGQLKRIYEKIKGTRGKVANIMKIHSLNPRSMETHLALYVNLMFGQSKLSREEREIIATAVSSANNCDYCKLHHGEALNHYWKDKEKIQQFMEDPLGLDLPEKTKAMIQYALKLTKTPDQVSEEDVESLRNAGFSDRDILDIALITSYFNFVNRIALGLGVEFSPEEISGYNY